MGGQPCNSSNERGGGSHRLKREHMTRNHMTETQIGALGENIVASHLIQASGGRLSPFKPIADDGGIDLLIYDKVTGFAVPIQIKSRTKTVRRYPKTVHFEVRAATFNEKGGGYLLAVLFDLNALEVKRAWLIPMAELEDVARTSTEKLTIQPSWDMKSRDKYTTYRCKDLTEVTTRFVKLF